MRNAFISLAFYALTIGISLSTLVAKADSLAGVLQKKDGVFFLNLASNNQLYSLRNISADANESLLKLNSGDYINGNGIIDDKNHQISLQSLDYVGLKKLLGIWYSNDSVMNFSSFNNLSVYPINSPFNLNGVANIMVKNDFRYSTAPYYGDRWALFMSDNSGTTFATVEINTDSATLRTFNSETGAVLRTLRLVRWIH